MVRRASSSSGAICSILIPLEAVNLPKSRLAAEMSACLVSAQKPSPSLSSTQATGSSRRMRANVAWGTRPHEGVV